MVAKRFWIVGIAALAGWGLFKGLSLKETGENIRISLAAVPKIHKIDLTGLKLSVDLRVDNPGKERIKVKLPMMRLTYKGKLVASTPINSTVYTIEPEATGKIPNIMIEAGYLSLISAAPGLLTDKNLMQSIGFEAMVEINGLPIKIQKL